MPYDNIKSQGFTLSLEDTFFEKPQGEGKTDPPLVVYIGPGWASKKTLIFVNHNFFMAKKL